MTRPAVSLRLLLPGAVAAFTLAMLSAMAWVQLRTAREQQLARATADLRATAAELRNDLDREARRGDRAGLTGAVVWTGIHPNSAGTALVGPDGRVIAATHAEWVGEPAAEALPGWLHAFTGPTPPGGRVEGDGQSDRIVSAFPVDLDGTGRAETGGVLVYALDAARPVAEARAAVWNRFRLLAAVTLAVAAALGVALNALISRRVSRLLATVERIGGGDLTARPEVGGGDELGRLAAGLAEMAERLVAASAERVRAEAALRESEERLRMFVEHVPAGVAMLDRELRYLSYSRRWLTDYRLGDQNLIGRCHYDVFPEIPDRWREIHRRCLAGGSARSDGDRFDRPDGTATYLRWEIQPWRDAGGAVGGLVFFTEDITERVRAEEEVRRTAGLLQAVADGAPDAIFVKDRAGRYLLFNRAAARFVGKPVADVLGRDDTEVFEPESARFLMERDRRVMDLAVSEEQEETITAGGVTRTYFARKAPYRDASGAVVGLIGIATDISERKQMERALRESEEKLRTIVDNEPECVKLLDRQGRLLEMNPAGLKMIEAEDLGAVRGADVLSLLAAGDRAAFADMVEAVFRGESRRLTFGVRGLAGTRRVLDTHSVPLWSADRSEVRALLGVTRDVTDRVRAEQALRKSEERFKTLAGSAPVGIFETDLKGSCLFVNARWCELTALSPEQASGDGWARALHPGDRERVSAAWAAAVESGTEFALDYRFRRPDGAAVWVSGSAVALRDASGTVRGYIGTVTDITARKAADAAVRQSEERFRLASEAFQGLLYDLDLVTKAVYRSAGVQDLLGYAPEEIEGDQNGWVELIHPDDRARVEAQFGAALAGGTRIDLEYQLRHRDGRYLDVWDRGQIVRAPDGTPVRIVGSTLDQTDRRRAEHELRVRTALLEALVDSTPDAIIGVGTAGTVLLHNRRHAELWKIPPELADDPDDAAQIRYVSSRVVDPEGFAARVAELYADPLRQARDVVALVDGTELDRFSGPILDRAGKCYGRLWTFRDVTERRRAEEEIRALNADLERRVAERTAEMSRLVAVLDTSPDFIAISQDPAGPSLYDNAAMVRMAAARGLGPGELNVRTFHPPESVRLLTEVAVPAALRDGTWVGESEVLGPAGRVIPVSQLIQAHKGPDGGVQYLSTIMRDISDLKQLERDLRQSRDSLLRVNAELSKASRLKDEFLASMSHELRTPLNGVLALAESLQEGVYGPVNPAQAAAVRDIEQSGRHLLALINDILDLSKIEAGQIALEPAPVDVDALCQGALRLVREMAQKKRHRVTTSVDGAVGLIVADAKRLKQVLVNLLSNAVKFTPDGGAVGLEVTADPDRRAITFAVWDTGIGIRPEDFELLFQPFRQIDSRLSREFAGTGLGLALVRRMVELHGGGVQLASTPGQGSRFTVTIPWQPAAPADPDLGPATAPVRKVLVVEDSPDDARKLERYLAALNVQAVIHPGAGGAVERVRAERPDLVLLDLLLPDGDGWQVLSVLKRDADVGAVPVVVLSVVDDRPQCLALGAAEVLVKPIDRETLRTTLLRVVSPLAGQRAVAILPPAPPATAPLVLLAEDNPLNARTVGDYLRASGYRVEVAENGSQAVEMAKSLCPAIVLMDVQMPRMDGLEATRRLRASTATATIPVVAVTALAMPGDRERCLAVGANEYLTKPVSLHQLREIIARLIGSPSLPAPE